MELHFSNFIKYFIFHPNSQLLNAKDRAIALVSSLALGVLTLGITHCVSAILYHSYRLLPADPLIYALFQQALQKVCREPLKNPDILGQVMSYLSPEDQLAASTVSKEWKSQAYETVFCEVKSFFSSLHSLIVFMKEVKNKEGLLKYAEEVDNLLRLQREGPQSINLKTLRTLVATTAPLQEQFRTILKALDLGDLQGLKKHCQDKLHDQFLVQVVSTTLFAKELDLWEESCKTVRRDGMRFIERRGLAKDRIFSCYQNRHSREGKSLSLRNLKLTSLPTVMSQLTHLKALDLTDNCLSVLPESVLQLTDLQELYLADNHPTLFSTRCAVFTHLKKLDLSSNELTEFPTDILSLMHLQELYLDNNQLSKLPEEISRLTHLQWLCVRGNKLTALPGSIGKLTNLTYLILHDNQLTALPTEIGSLTRLQELALSGNQLTVLPEEMGNLLHLQNLYSAYNQLKALPRSIGKLSHLQVLALGHNQLTTLPEEMGSLTCLQTLYLSCNQLQVFSRKMTALRKLNSFELKNNPLPLNEQDHIRAVFGAKVTL